MAATWSWSSQPAADRAAHFLRRLDDGLEQGLTLVLAKAVLGLTDALGAEEATPVVLKAGVDFGVRNRDTGWGAGLTVLTAMANVLPVLEAADRPLALVHGLSFVARDTRGHAPRFALDPLPGSLPAERLASWYRRFADTRGGDATERTLATAAGGRVPTDVLAAMMGAACTDHVFVDGGHTIDFTNKAFEMLDHAGWDMASTVLPTLAHQTAMALPRRGDRRVAPPRTIWLDCCGRRARPFRPGWRRGRPEGSAPSAGTRMSTPWPGPFSATTRLRRSAPSTVPLDRGATAEELARAVAYAAALRVTRFHTDNDHADWDVVHHGFTAANAVHQLVVRAGTPELLRGVYQGALKVFLDRFLNVPAARVGRHGAPPQPGRSLDLLQACWDQQGMVDEAGEIVYDHVTSGGDPSAVLAALGSGLLREDAEFHWFQTYEAAVRQSRAWPAGSEQSALDPGRGGAVPRGPYPHPAGAAPGGADRRAAAAG